MIMAFCYLVNLVFFGRMQPPRDLGMLRAALREKSLPTPVVVCVPVFCLISFYTLGPYLKLSFLSSYQSITHLNLKLKHISRAP